MLMEDYLDLKKIFSPEIMWEIKPKRIPGKVVRKLSNGVTGFIEPSIEIHYPDGELMKDVYSAELAEFSVGEQVIFSLRDAKKIDGKNPNLQNAYDVEFALGDHLDNLGYEFDPAKLASLGRTLNEAIEDVTDKQMTLGKEIERQVSDRLKTRIQELDDLEKSLQELQSQLQFRELELEKKERKIEQTVAEKVAEQKLALDTREAELESRFQKLAERENLLKSQQESLEGERKQLAGARAKFQEEGGEKYVGVLSILEESEAPTIELTPLADALPPNDFIARLDTFLAKNNYMIDPFVSLKFLLSTLTAAVTGQFVVLSGPTGVGKTSMVNAFSSALGAGSGVVPVHPSWIDPTDLLGFYNPQQERFQSSPFMDLYLDAARYTDANRLYFLTLDEMNLARVENYAADFLSRLEKARVGEKNVSIQLYSSEVEQQLRMKARKLKENGDQDFEIAIALLNHIKKYPANLSIPDGLVMFGTINLDETTHHLSPKFLDRSFVINIAHQGLLEKFTGLASGQLLTDPAFEMSLKTIQELGRDNSKISQSHQTLWQTILGWQEEFLEPLGIRLGFRFASMFGIYMQIAANLGLGAESKIADTFLQAKLLPWISFHRDDKADGTENRLKIDVLRDWMGDSSLGQFGGKGGLRDSLQKILERSSSSLIVQYLE